MKSSEILLLFLIIYNTITTILFLYIWLKTREISMKKSDYITDLQNELVKLRMK